MPKELSGHPEAVNLMAFVKRLLEKHSDKISFIVVFGSAAKGTWMMHSDVDVLVGLSIDDGMRLIDRIGLFAQEAKGNIDVFPYARSEWKRMFDAFNPLLLEALEDGIVIYDDGSFATIRETFRHLRSIGKIVRHNLGWKIVAL